MFMLDTNSASKFIAKRSPSIDRRINQTDISEICISAISAGELKYGITKNKVKKKLEQLVTEFLNYIEILPWDEQCIVAYANLRSQCEKNGIIPGPLDLLIGAHAISVGAILITNDSGLLALHEKLSVEDWTE